MALNGLYCADVPLSNYSLTHASLVGHRGRLSSCLQRSYCCGEANKDVTAVSKWIAGQGLR